MGVYNFVFELEIWNVYMRCYYSTNVNIIDMISLLLYTGVLKLAWGKFLHHMGVWNWFKAFLNHRGVYNDIRHFLHHMGLCNWPKVGFFITWVYAIDLRCFLTRMGICNWREVFFTSRGCMQLTYGVFYITQVYAINIRRFLHHTGVYIYAINIRCFFTSHGCMQLTYGVFISHGCMQLA